jgi:hypothetical protein
MSAGVALALMASPGHAEAGETPRNEADRILAEALAQEDVHNRSAAITRLAELKATPQLARLFATNTVHSCCIYQQLLTAIEACATLSDVPVLIPLIATETEDSGPVIRSLLADITRIDGSRAWSSEQWWNWWKANSAPATLRFPVLNCAGGIHINADEVEVLRADGTPWTETRVVSSTAVVRAIAGGVTNLLGGFSTGCSGRPVLHSTAPDWPDGSPSRVILEMEAQTPEGIMRTGRTVIVREEW